MMDEARQLNFSRARHELGNLVDQTDRFFRLEAKKVKTLFEEEMEEKRKAGVRMTTGIAIGLIGLAFLSMALVQVLMVYTSLPAWGCYLVAALCLLLLSTVLLNIKSNSKSDREKDNVAGITEDRSRAIDDKG